MKYPRSLKSLIPPSSPVVKSYRKMSTTTPDRQATTTPRNTIPQRPKRPPLTHFLCLPLVNATSLPQLESSLAAFKQAIPFCPRKENESALKPFRPLIPDGALRPVGTLHLTLGVMSLPTKERLDEAVEFLEGLDLVDMMREAERIANTVEKRGGRMPRRATEEAVRISNFEGETRGSSLREESESQSAVVPQPFTISLESLHALPRARNATVLHAAPVDSTSRLYPFCVMLRDKFLEAGFMQAEYRGKGQVEGGGSAQQQHQTSSPQNLSSTAAATAAATTEQSHLSLIPELPVDLAVESNRNTTPKPRRPKTRPLLLHATVVNTIYVKGRRRGNNNNNGPRRNGKFGRNSNDNQYSFDARDILAHYRDYYFDSDRTQPRATTITLRTETTTATEQNREQETNASTTNLDDDGSSSTTGQEIEIQPEKEEGQPNRTNETKNPFLWAKDFPLEKICICEMGAKKPDLLSLSSGTESMAARLGEQYRVVAERSLVFDTDADADTGTSVDAASFDDESVEGGVAVS